MYIIQYLSISYSILGYHSNSKQAANLSLVVRHLYENSLTKAKDSLGVGRIKGFKEISVLK